MEAIDEEDELPGAFLFVNGNAAYFNEDGEQIPSLQKDGWEAVHDFLEEYPDAPVKVASYHGFGTGVELSDRAIEQIARRRGR